MTCKEEIPWKNISFEILHLTQGYFWFFETMCIRMLDRFHESSDIFSWFWSTNQMMWNICCWLALFCCSCQESEREKTEHWFEFKQIYFCFLFVIREREFDCAMYSSAIECVFLFHLSITRQAREYMWCSVRLVFFLFSRRYDIIDDMSMIINEKKTC